MTKKIRCPRCRGIKNMYKIRNGYCATNCGGELVKCPCCLGDGVIEPLEEMVSKVELTETKPTKPNRRYKNGREALSTDTR